MWFSEGTTTTAANIILLRAGLLDETRYLKGLAAEISELERRPAHLTQSVEESSLDAWLEKYDYYRLPARSISYYNKGNLLGVLLDLQVREATHDAASIRDVFHWMNENYARKGQFFPDTEGVRRAAEAVSHADLGWFFQKYVAGTEEIPWDDFFKNVGLHLSPTRDQRCRSRIRGHPELRRCAGGVCSHAGKRSRACRTGRRRFHSGDQRTESRSRVCRTLRRSSPGRDASPAGTQLSRRARIALEDWAAGRKLSWS